MPDLVIAGNRLGTKATPWRHELGKWLRSTIHDGLNRPASQVKVREGVLSRAADWLERLEDDSPLLLTLHRLRISRTPGSTGPLVGAGNVGRLLAAIGHDLSIEPHPEDLVNELVASAVADLSEVHRTQARVGQDKAVRDTVQRERGVMESAITQAQDSERQAHDQLARTGAKLEEVTRERDHLLTLLDMDDLVGKTSKPEPEEKPKSKPKRRREPVETGIYKSTRRDGTVFYEARVDGELKRASSLEEARKLRQGADSPERSPQGGGAVASLEDAKAAYRAAQQEAGD